jgi:hypothetical protein
VRLSVALTAALSLVMGFGVASATGARWAGGIVLVLGWAWCARRWWQVGRTTAVGLTLLFLAAFAVSHPLGHLIGAWPSVLLVAAVMGGASFTATGALDERTAAPS